MASANPAAVADRLLETLRDLSAVEEIRRYIGVHEELQKLKGTVLSTMAVLADAVARTSRNASLASWVQQIQEILHEVDDAVDELRTEILWKRELMCGDRVVTKVCISLPITFNHLVFRRKLRELREHVEDFLPRRHRFTLVAGAIELNRASLLASDTHNYVRFSEENLFGRDSDLEAIVENLVRPYSEEQNVSIISLVGTAGLGKTALARKAFDHERVVGHFGIRIWVDVSGAFDHQNVLYRVPRHVSFDLSLSSPRQIPTSFPAARLRSILFTCQSSIKQEGSSSRAICDAIISNMKFLRTLDLHDSGIERVPDHIDGLKHLRYLYLSRNVKMRVLPKSITKLRNLQTLKLSLCFRLQELPSDIKKLANLRHLEIDGCYNLTHMPRGLGELTQLRTLSQFVSSKDARSVSQHDMGQLNELSSLKELRGELQIKNLRHDMDVGNACLEKKWNLQSLALD